MKKIIALIVFGVLSSPQVFANAYLAISNVIEEYEVALNNSDTKAVLALYGKSPTFMPQHAPAQIGKSTIKKAYQGVFKAIDLQVSFTIHNIEVHGDTAWVRTSSAGKTKILANGAEINEGNNELFIFKKEQENWKIHQYIFSTNQAR